MTPLRDSSLKQFVLLTCGIAVLAGGVGFGVGKITAPVQITARQSLALPGRSSGFTMASAPGRERDSGSGPTASGLPSPDFRDPVEFDSYVRTLIARGLEKGHAQWLALTWKAGSDFPLAYEVARQRKLLHLWASGAAQSNPREAFQLIRALPKKESESALASFFSVLGRSQPRLGFELIEQLPREAFWDKRISFFRSWAAAAPGDAASCALTVSTAFARRVSMYGALNAWGEKDCEAMLDWAAHQDRWVLSVAFNTLHNVIRDPMAALKLMERYPGAGGVFWAAGIADALSLEGASGWEKLSTLPDGPLREQILVRFGSALVSRDPKLAWELAKKMSPAERANFLRFSVHELASAFPREVAEFRAAEGTLNALETSSLVRAWSDTDPSAAIAWSLGNLKGVSLNQAMNASLYAMIKKDPQAALSAWEKLPAGLRAETLPSLVQPWGETDPEKALDWAATLDPIGRKRAIEEIVNGWSARDPFAAAEAVIEMPGEKSRSMLDVVAARLAEKDPNRAADWVGRLPSTQVPGVMESMVGKWAQQDANAAADYLGKLRAGEIRDKAINGFVQSVAELDPATAAQWANAIGAPSVKKHALKSALNAWRQSDADAARQFAVSLVEAELRTEMLRLFQ